MEQEMSTMCSLTSHHSEIFQNRGKASFRLEGAIIPWNQTAVHCCCPLFGSSSVSGDYSMKGRNIRESLIHSSSLLLQV